MADEPTPPRRAPLAPLQIKCTDTRCEDDLHCYLATRKMAAGKQVGACRDCGAHPVEWSRVHARDLGDAAYTFQVMRTELIRHHFWHTPIDEKAVKHARRKGKRGMREAAIQRIRKSVAAAAPVRDGRQTPFTGNALFYAQHATATCCRRCIEEWHAISRGRALTEDEVRYLSDLIVLYIDERLPALTEEGEYIPRAGTRAAAGRAARVPTSAAAHRPAGRAKPPVGASD